MSKILKLFKPVLNFNKYLMNKNRKKSNFKIMFIILYYDINDIKCEKNIIKSRT